MTRKNTLKNIDFIIKLKSVSKFAVVAVVVYVQIAMQQIMLDTILKVVLVQV